MRALLQQIAALLLAIIDRADEVPDDIGQAADQLIDQVEAAIHDTDDNP